MFTGIIEELGKVQHITTNKIQITCSIVSDGVKLGDSISVNGVCLTVTDITSKSFTADISEETGKVTTLNLIKTGDFVNLERAMKVDGRFGGHIVTGHTDCTARCENMNKLGEFYNISFKLQSEFAKYVVNKGSVAINGISLTVAHSDENIITIAVIPHTYENTCLKLLKVGDYVNIEFDILAKYIEKFLLSGDNSSRIDKNFLTRCGFN